MQNQHSSTVRCAHKINVFQTLASFFGSSQRCCKHSVVAIKSQLSTQTSRLRVVLVTIIC